MTGFGLVALMLLVVPLTPLDWRVLYLAALPPLALVVWLRRNLNETTAFNVAQAQERIQTSFWPHVGPEHRPRLWGIVGVLGVHGMLATPMFFYAAELAQDGYGWEGLFTVIVIAAGPATLLGYVVGGKVSDRVGRKPVVIAGSLATLVGVALVYSEQRWLFAPGFFVMTGGGAAVEAGRPAYLSELFPPRCAPPCWRSSTASRWRRVRWASCSSVCSTAPCRPARASGGSRS